MIMVLLKCKFTCFFQNKSFSDMFFIFPLEKRCGFSLPDNYFFAKMMLVSMKSIKFASTLSLSIPVNCHF